MSIGDEPLCFVLMPFGNKPDPAGGADIDFNHIYQAAIQPGIRDAGMLPIRADEEELGGIIHQAMYERLLLCEYAVADLTTGNPNVLYELGVRHAARPRTTLTVYATRKPLPFDVAPLRTQPYELGAANTFPDDNAAELRKRIGQALRRLRLLSHDDQDVTDSPLFQLVHGWQPEPLALEAAASFQDQLRAVEAVKNRLAAVRTRSRVPELRLTAAAELAELRRQVTASAMVDTGIWAGLMLGYRALSDWTGMIEVYEQLPDVLKGQAAVREMLAFAHSRRAETTDDPVDRELALTILHQLQQSQGRTSEVSGLIGRIHKFQYTQARDNNDLIKAGGHLDRAIAAYVEGFETDWRDIYPGVNAVTLLDVRGDEEARAQKERLLPVVRFAVEQRRRAPNPDYWDHASLLEITVVADQPAQAAKVLTSVLTTFSEHWQIKTTVDNLRIIERARRERGGEVGWLNDIMTALDPPTP